MGFAADGSFFYGVKVSTRTISLAPIDAETGRLVGDPTTIDPRNIGNLSRPSWSADGRYLSYLNGEFRAGPRIMIRSLETGETREFNPRLPTAYPPRWSPDGRYLLLLAQNESDQRSIYRIDVQTGEVRELRAFEAGQGVFKASWGPDGRTVYFKVDFERQSHLVALDVESGVERIIHSATMPTWITIYWNVSSDGKWIGYWQRDRMEGTRSRVLRLMLIPSSGTKEPRELTRVDWSGQGLFPVEGAWWTDGGKSLLYAKAAGEGENLKVEFWKVPVDGGEPVLTNLRLDGWTAGRPQFSPDGRMVAYETGESAHEVWVMKNYLPER